MFVCTRVYLYIMMGCTDGVTIVMCPCVLLAAIVMLCYQLTVYSTWCASLKILYNYGHICVTVIILLYHYILLIILQDMASV